MGIILNPPRMAVIIKASLMMTVMIIKDQPGDGKGYYQDQPGYGGGYYQGQQGYDGRNYHKVQFLGYGGGYNNQNQPYDKWVK